MVSCYHRHTCLTPRWPDKLGEWRVSCLWRPYRLGRGRRVVGIQLVNTGPHTCHLVNPYYDSIIVVSFLYYCYKQRIRIDDIVYHGQANFLECTDILNTHVHTHSVKCVKTMSNMTLTQSCCSFFRSFLGLTANTSVDICAQQGNKITS